MKMKEENTCICVLGMHRSGTSLLTGILQEAGIPSVNRNNYNLGNHLGNREDVDFMRINRELLSFNNSSWKRPLNGRLNANQDLRLSALNLISARYSEYPTVVYKDPRMILTFQFWKELLPNPIYICTYRHPLKVALSLYHRDGLPIKEGLSLWLIYNNLLLSIIREYKVSVVCFDWEEKMYKQRITQFLTELQLRQAVFTKMHIQKGLDFYSSGLRHQEAVQVTFCRKKGSSIELWSACMNLYREFLQISHTMETHISGNRGLSIPIEPSNRCLEEIIVKQPGNAHALSMLATRYAESDEASKSVELLKTAIKHTPNSYWLYDQLIELLSEPEEIIEVLTQGLIFQPQIIHWHQRLSKEYYALNEPAKALDTLRKAIEKESRPFTRCTCCYLGI